MSTLSDYTHYHNMMGNWFSLFCQRGRSEFLWQLRSVCLNRTRSFFSSTAMHFNLLCVFSRGISVWRCDEIGHFVSAKSTINLLVIVDYSNYANKEYLVLTLHWFIVCLLFYLGIRCYYCPIWPAMGNKWSLLLWASSRSVSVSRSEVKVTRRI